MFVKKNGNAVYALICSALAMTSAFLAPYAFEARGYTPMCACVAIALVCYQRVDRTQWILLMGLSLVLAGMFHYYAVCALFPFVVAEGTFWLQTRSFRWGVWAALGCGMLPLIAFWPLLSAFKKYYGATFWAQPTLAVLLSFFGWFLNLPAAWGISVLATAFTGVVVIVVRNRYKQDFATAGAHSILHEQVLVLGVLALPFAIFLAMKITHGGLTERYMLPAGLGVPLAAGWLLPRVERRVVALFGVFLFSVWQHRKVRFGYASATIYGRSYLPPRMSKNC